jgi:excisionase family DNA binding protein
MNTASDRSMGEPRLAFGMQEVADALGISREHVEYMIRAGEMPIVKRGRRSHISRSASSCSAFPDTSARVSASTATTATPPESESESEFVRTNRVPEPRAAKLGQSPGHLACASGRS